MFTVDPVKDSRSSIVIEACFGLGETLVSGKVTPDRFIVSKKRLKLLSTTISEKKIEHSIGQNGSVEEKNVPDKRASVCCLDKKQVKKLAKFARKIETEFGSPQDIEWAIRKDKIFLLQSRPITALPPEKSWEDRQIWCCNPAKEVIPDVATPTTLSVIDAMFGSLGGFILMQTSGALYSETCPAPLILIWHLRVAIGVSKRSHGGCKPRQTRTCRT